LNRIYLDEGIRGLYKGYCATAVTIPVFHSIYFSVFYRAKSYLKENWTSENRPVVRDVVASAITGLIANTVTNPFWVVRTRIQSQFLHREEKVPKYTGLLPGLSQMYKEEGYRSLFKGLLASYLGLAHCIILFPLYEQLKTMLADPQGKLTNTDILVASNISKFIAMTATYPHIVVRARLQDHRTPKVSGQSAGKESLKMVDKYGATISSVIKSAYQKEGLKGLYSGLKIDLVRVLPANSITFIMFEYIKRRLEEALPREEKL